MRAFVIDRFGGPEVLELRDVPRPAPTSGQVLVRVRAIGLNFADVAERLGVYPGIPKPPFIPGMEFSGVIEELGEGVVSHLVGDRVMGYSFIGSHAEYVAVSERQVAPMTEAMSFEEGAAFLVSNLTAYHALVTLANGQRSEKILIHAAAGSVGLACLQMARYLGMEIIATAGTDEKLQLTRQHGAQHTINYQKLAFDEEVRRITAGYGVDVVVDSIGGRVFTPGWNLLAPMGRYVLYGFADAIKPGKFSKLHGTMAYLSMPKIHPARLPSLNRSLIGFNLSKLVHRTEYLMRAGLEIRRFLEANILKPIVGRVFCFEELPEAHTFLQNRLSVGKIVITVD